MKSSPKKVAKNVVKKAPKKVAPKSQKLTQKERDEIVSNVEGIGAEKLTGFFIVIVKEEDGYHLQGKFSSMSKAEVLALLVRDWEINPLQMMQIAAAAIRD